MKCSAWKGFIPWIKFSSSPMEDRIKRGSWVKGSNTGCSIIKVKKFELHTDKSSSPQTGYYPAHRGATSFKVEKCHFLTLFLTGFLTNWRLWGGRSAPPSYKAIRGYFEYSFRICFEYWTGQLRA